MSPQFKMILTMVCFMSFPIGCQMESAPEPLASEQNLGGASLDGLIREFESMGGTGIRFNSVMPAQLGGAKAAFYLVKSLPPQASPQAKLFLLRTEPTRKLFEGVVKSEKVPVVLGEIPIETQVFAAAMTGHQLVKDALRVGNIVDKHTAILITQRSSIFTLAHENRHWLDFEDSAFLERLKNEIKSFETRHRLDTTFTPTLFQLVIEIRGHITQAKQARNGARGRWPYVDAAGNIITQGLEAQYFFEQNQAVQIFEQAYLQLISTLLRPLNESQKTELATILKQYDSSDDPENKLTFRSVGVR
jgi:hypothetical protein